MPTSDKPTAMQVLPATLVERLTLAIGQMVVVYLMNVYAPSIIGEPVPCPPYPAPTPVPPPLVGPGVGGAYGGPPLTPGIPPGGGHVVPIPMMGCEPERPPCPSPCPPPCPIPGTTLVSGTLAFVGVDYLVIRIPAGVVCRDILIPYNAIGMIVLNGGAM